MHTVTIKGGELDYFRGIVRSALQGSYGDLSEVKVSIDDNGQVAFGTNDYTSALIGEPSAPLSQGDSRPEGSGNPYANVPDDDSDAEDAEQAVGSKRKLKARVAALEQMVSELIRVVDRAESTLNVRLRDQGATTSLTA